MQVYEDENGNISHFESDNKHNQECIDRVKTWALQKLKGYTGVVNIETIHGKIIDCHLRMTPRFVDLYGKNWLNSVVTLYEKNTWYYEFGRSYGVSYTIRAPKSGIYKIEDKEKFNELKGRAGSIQLIFKKDIPVGVESRLAIVNGHDAEQVTAIINELNDIIILTKE